MAIPQDLQSPV